MEIHGTLATSIYGRLRRDILVGVFQPGQKLRIEALCERYAIGSTPLREALNRLSAEELVMREEQRGFRVAPVSAQDLAELTKTLCWVVEIGLRESIGNGDAAWEEAIVLAGHRLARVQREGAEGYGSFNPEWERRHRDFHLALVAATGSRWLLDFYAMLVDRYDRYMYLAAVEVPWAERDVIGEHQAMMDAVLARDASGAVAAATAHIRRTAEIVLQAQAATLARLAAAPAPAPRERGPRP